MKLKRDLAYNHRVPANIPLGYFISFHTYGTWLHGDARGSVDPQHHRHDSPLVPPDEALLAAELARLKHPAVTLGCSPRQVIEATIAEVCAHRGWTLQAFNIRINHVHTVVTAEHHSPERILGDFKAWSTRRLREAALFPPNLHPWSKHGSTPYLWTEAQFQGAIAYVLYGQGPDLHGTP